MQEIVEYINEDEVEQKIWRYIRKKRHFSVADLRMITEAKLKEVKAYFLALENAGYLKATNKKRFPARSYHLKICNGFRAPIIKDGKLIDSDIDKTIELDIDLNKNPTRTGAITTKKTKKQSFWEYMKSNNIFRVKEAIKETDISNSMAKTYIWYLSKAKYLKLIEDKRNFYERVYSFIKDTGEIAPIYSENTLYDYNTKEEIKILKTSLENEIEFLRVMTKKEMSKEEIVKLTNKEIHIRVSNRVFKTLIDDFVMTKVTPPRRGEDKKLLYKIDLSKVKERLKELEKE